MTNLTESAAEVAALLRNGGLSVDLVLAETEDPEIRRESLHCMLANLNHARLNLSDYMGTP